MNRGQMILAAGALIAIALIATLLAILQLGYHPPAATAEEYTPSGETRRVIEEALIEAEPAARAYAWTNRTAAAAAVRAIVSERLSALERTEGTGVRRVEFAPHAAAEVLPRICPRESGQRFGPCAAIDGIVVQERAHTAHLVGVVVRVTIRHEDGSATMTMVIRPLPRVVEETDH